MSGYTKYSPSKLILQHDANKKDFGEVEWVSQPI